MSLTGLPLAVLVTLLALGLPVGLLVMWGRLPHLALRAGWLLLCQVFAVVFVLLLINNHFQLYGSWRDLTGFGSADAAGVPILSSAAPPRGSVTAVSSHALSTMARYDNGYVVNLLGVRSGVEAPVYVWLPPEYDQARYAHVRFPVVELLPGFPGTPTTWLNAMHLVQRVQQARQRGAEPFVFVLPTITVDPPVDTECSDVPGYPKAGTFLTQDVRSFITTHLRVRTDAGGWGIEGYSTGGFCAVKLALQHPDLYAAAVSLSGYFATSSSVFRPYPALARQNSPLWLEQHGPTAPVSLLLVATEQDHGTAAAVAAMQRSARPPTGVGRTVLRWGGHNTRVWSPLVPDTLVWLSRHLPTPGLSTGVQVVRLS
jgi:pimeloyl-ACP methyl ester carboxylesterase